MNGIINVYKEKGMTSFSVVSRLRRIIGMKKIGHTGTLDPDAQGVLPVCLGNATKVCELLTDRDKTYEAVMRLGFVTDTQDMSGEILKEAAPETDERRIRECIAGFIGDYMQVPPMYSALKVNGQKLCDLARQGVTVERKARPVHFYEIEVLEINVPLVRMRVRCSKGTYIRTLCNDIGERLGCGAAMESLLRTQVSPFALDTAHTLSEIEEKKAEGSLEEWVVSVDALFTHLPALKVMGDGEKKLKNGNMLCAADFECCEVSEGRARVYDAAGVFTAIYEYNKDLALFETVKMFL